MRVAILSMLVLLVASRGRAQDATQLQWELRIGTPGSTETRVIALGVDDEVVALPDGMTWRCHVLPATHTGATADDVRRDIRVLSCTRGEGTAAAHFDAEAQCAVRHAGMLLVSDQLPAIVTLAGPTPARLVLWCSPDSLDAAYSAAAAADTSDSPAFAHGFDFRRASADESTWGTDQTCAVGGVGVPHRVTDSARHSRWFAHAPAQAEVYVSIDCGRDATFASVRVFFASGQLDRVLALRRGDQVTLHVLHPDGGGAQATLRP